MRGIILIFAGSIMAGCGGPDAEPSANAGVEEPQGAPPAPAPPQPEPVINEVNSATISPCLMQGPDRLEVAPIRAVGTEPFWAAKVEGRCVTYSTPENQQGVRVWTRYSAKADGRAEWAGRLAGKPFELRVRPEPACSDGMSDERYPLAVELLVNGEQRRGCAKPI